MLHPLDEIVFGWIESGFFIAFYPLEVQLQLVHRDDNQPKASNLPPAKRPYTALSDKQTQ